MGLPFKPESLASAKQRFPDALTYLWDGALVREGKLPKRLDLDRRHVFDFESGIRMCAAAEWFVKKGDKKPRYHIHLSFAALESVDRQLANDELNFLLLAFVGHREQLACLPQQNHAVMHFFYGYDPSSLQLLRLQFEAGVKFPDPLGGKGPAAH